MLFGLDGKFLVFKLGKDFIPSSRQTSALFVGETVVGSGHAFWGAGFAQHPNKSGFVVGETQSSHIQDALV